MEQADLELAKARSYIYSIDFSNIIHKMVKHQGWLYKDAQKTCQLYRNYLFLKRKYGSKHALPPSKDIDEFWHLHILDTKSYRQDCVAIFGEYLDHYPYFGIDKTSNFDDLNQAFSKMQELHEHEFGEKIYQSRSLISKLLFFFHLIRN